MLVQVDELLHYMNVTRTSDNARKALELTLAGVQEELETYLYRPVEPIQIREVSKTNTMGELTLSITPVHVIINQTPITRTGLVTYASQSVTVPGMTTEDIISRPVLDWSSNTVKTTFFREPQIIPGGIFVGYPNQWVSVEYIGGWRGWQVNGLKMAILRVASRDAEPIVDDTVGRKADSTESESKSDARVTGWTPDELTRWDRLRRRVAV